MCRARPRSLVALSTLLLGLWAVPASFANECPGNLDEMIEVTPDPPGNDYDVYFTTMGGSPDRTLPGIASEIRDATGASHDVFVSPGYGFPNPYFSVTPNDSCIYEFPEYGDASARPSYIRYKTSAVAEEDEPGRRRIVLHELFHHVTYETLDFDEYVDWGPWFVEGPPAMMEDKTFADLDDDPYRKYRNEYVALAIDDPNFPLTNQQRGYGTALFWTYFTERLGTTTSEPGYGIDAMRLLLENMGGRSPDSFGVLRDTMAELGSPEIGRAHV